MSQEFLKVIKMSEAVSPLHIFSMQKFRHKIPIFKPREIFCIKKSGISGKGVFAASDIKAGETICFMEGEKISLQELGRRLHKNPEKEGDALQIDDETYIDMEEEFRCINHSCNPNAGIRGENELFALRDIKKEEEIFYDYSTTMWEDEIKIKKWLGLPLWEMSCKCAEKNCRKVIGQFYNLPDVVQKRYITQKAVPQFILQKYL